MAHPHAGLVLMVVLSMLPIGILQTIAAVEQGTWWARSADFLQTPLMNTLRWLRAPGDTVFALGVGFLAWFVVGLKTGWSLEPAATFHPEPREAASGPLAAPAPVAVRRR